MGKFVFFRAAKVLPIDIIPGAGLVCPLQDQISAIAQDLEAMPEDDARARLLPPLSTADTALARALRVHWQIADAVQATLSDPATKRMLTRTQSDAAGRLPVRGWGGPEDLAAAQGAERARTLRQFQQDAADAAIAGKSTKIAEAGEAVVTAMGGAEDAIEEAVADFESPSALSQDIELVDLQRIASCEQEILSWGDQAMPKTLLELERLIRFKKEDKLKAFLPAAIRAANEILKTPPPKLARQANHYSGALYTSQFQDTPHERARRVLKTIAAYRETQRPQSIQIATNCLQRMRPIFAAVLGKDAPQFLSSAERERLYYGPGGQNGAHKGPAWEIDPKWPYRYAPPSPTPLPGWSKIVARTEGRVPVREPSPAPMVRAEVEVDS